VGNGVRFVGTVIVGVSGNEASRALSTDAKVTMLNVIGVDLMSLAIRGKFVFVAQIGSPEKAAVELRGKSQPHGIRMDVLITGRCRSMNAAVNARLTPTASDCSEICQNFTDI